MNDELESWKTKVFKLDERFSALEKGLDWNLVELQKQIADLKKNCEGSFAKVEDHIKRILEVIDIQAQSIDLLREQIEKLKNK